MNRRKFLKAFFGAVATVSIGIKLHEAMPEPKPQEWTYIAGNGVHQAWKFDYRSVILNPSAIVRVDTV